MAPAGQRELSLADETIGIPPSETVFGWNRQPDPRFFCSTFDVPNPPGVSLFRSTVSGGGSLTDEDVIAFIDHAQTAVIEPLTPLTRLSRLADDVQLLVEAGSLTQDQADGLSDKLTEAAAKLEGGQTGPAINQLLAFIRQVERLVPLQLSAAGAQELVAQAEAVIEQLEG